MSLEWKNPIFARLQNKELSTLYYYDGLDNHELSDFILFFIITSGEKIKLSNLRLAVFTVSVELCLFWYDFLINEMNGFFPEKMMSMQ